jgi:sortase (surface protein transpeptidase)
LVGHRSWTKEPAIFDSLDAVKVGDTVLIHESSLVKSVYVVSSIEVFNSGDSALEALAPESGPTIKLVSCTGTWNSKEHSSSQRIVVTARKFSK